MVECVSKKDAVEFWKDGKMIYDISHGDVRRMGHQYWLQHMSNKSWCTMDTLIKLQKSLEQLAKYSARYT